MVHSHRHARTNRINNWWLLFDIIKMVEEKPKSWPNDDNFCIDSMQKGQEREKIFCAIFSLLVDSKANHHLTIRWSFFIHSIDRVSNLVDWSCYCLGCFVRLSLPLKLCFKYIDVDFIFTIISIFFFAFFLHFSSMVSGHDSSIKQKWSQRKREKIGYIIHFG